MKACWRRFPFLVKACVTCRMSHNMVPYSFTSPQPHPFSSFTCTHSPLTCTHSPAHILTLTYTLLPFTCSHSLPHIHSPLAYSHSLPCIHSSPSHIHILLPSHTFSSPSYSHTPLTYTILPHMHMHITLIFHLSFSFLLLLGDRVFGEVGTSDSSRCFGTVHVPGWGGHCGPRGTRGGLLHHC